MAKEKAKVKSKTKVKEPDFIFDKIIKSRVVTEKSFNNADQLKKYTFYLEGDKNKLEAKKIIENKYKVKVAKINIITVPGKLKKTRTVKGMQIKRYPDRKKVMFTLNEKDEIKNFTQI